MKMHLIGCSHHSTPVEIREQLAFSPQLAREAIERFAVEYPDTECVLLSTCNRTELYTASVDPDRFPHRAEVAQFLSRVQNIDSSTLGEYLVEREGNDVVRHLFRVAASLDSMVVGEAQILSQVKQAYELAADHGPNMPVLHTAFQHALKAAKRVSSETEIQRKRVSIPSVAVADFAQRIFEKFEDKSVIVIGAGEMAAETLTYLRDLGVQHVRLINRNQERAAALAQEWSAQVVAWDDMDRALESADIVVTATGATEPIMTADRFQPIQRKRAQRPLFILDLAIPRDFDPKIGDALGVYLYSIDDLQEVCDANLRARAKELPKAEKIINQEADRFVVDWNMRISGATIQQLRAMADQIKDAELDRLQHKLDRLDERERDEIARSFDRLVNKLLHPPLESLRHGAQDGGHASLLMALKRLFQLKD